MIKIYQIINIIVQFEALNRGNIGLTTVVQLLMLYCRIMLDQCQCATIDMLLTPPSIFQTLAKQLIATSDILYI